MYKLIHNLAILGALSVSSVAFAAVTPYSTNFEPTATDQTKIFTLADDGWIGYVNIFDGGVRQYGYGTFPLLNSAGTINELGDPGSVPDQIAAVASGEGDLSQGDQQLSIYGPYDNPDLCNSGYEGQTNGFQEQTISLADIGNTWVFRFDVKRGNLELLSTATAFIKTIQPYEPYSATNIETLDTTLFPTTWTNVQEISLLLDATDDVDNSNGALGADGIPDLVGQSIQFGFSSTAECLEGSGVFYDNVEWFAGGGLDVAGDINGDGQINAGDLVLGATILFGLYTPTPSEQARFDIAPLSGGLPVPDGNINVGDYIILLRLVSGNIFF